MSHPVVNISESYSVARETLEAEHRATLRKRQDESERAARKRRLLLNWSFAICGAFLLALMYFR